MPAIAANDIPQWRNEILEQYLASVQKEHIEGHDSDEAMSTDSDSEFESEGDSVSFAPSSSLSTAFSSITLFDAVQPDDIDSDDSAFSSEDEFAEVATREQQRVRRLLVLGRAPPSLLLLRPRQLTDMNQAYMKQLNDADAELAELKGVEPQLVVQRPNVMEYLQPVDLHGPDVAAIVHELRQRSEKEIAELEKEDKVRGVVLLAQALFRKEREVKRIRKEQESNENDN